MRALRLLFSVLFSCVLITPTVAADSPIEGLGPVGPVEKVAGGFAFTEGPTYADGALYFTDIPNERIHRLAAGDDVEVFANGSRHANGLMHAGSGKLLACEMDGQLVEYDLSSKARRVLAGDYKGVRFNAPNDLVIDSSGGVYFTDPRFRAPEPLPQGGQFVYYRSADGKVSRVTPDLPAPNGVMLSLDEKVLYALPSDSPSMRAYDIVSPGKVGAGREFCKVKQSRKSGRSGSDGVTLDSRGNLYLTTHLGLQVVSPAGELLGVIAVPEVPANVTFGGEDFRTLYVTARTSVYAIPMAVEGRRFGGQ